MVNKKFLILLLSILFSSCMNYYLIKKGTNGEPNVDMNLYSFNKKMSKENTLIIDTTSIYLEIVSDVESQEKKDNPEIILFHNDGFYERKSKKYFYESFSNRKKESVYYGGKFILDHNNLKLEKFYPSSGGKTNYYVKEVSEGSVRNDSVFLTIFRAKYIYIKKSFNDVFKK